VKDSFIAASKFAVQPSERFGAALISTVGSQFFKYNAEKKHWTTSMVESLIFGDANMLDMISPRCNILQGKWLNIDVLEEMSLTRSRT